MTSIAARLGVPSRLDAATAKRPTSDVYSTLGEKSERLQRDVVRRATSRADVIFAPFGKQRFFVMTDR